MAPAEPERAEVRQGPALHQRLRELTPAQRKRLALAPEEVLGPYDGLSRSDRQALREAVESWDAASTRGYENELVEPCLRWLWRLRRECRGWREAGRPLGRPLFRLADEIAFAARQAPAWLGRILHRAKVELRSRFPTPDAGPVPGALVSRRIDPHHFAVCYCRSLRQRPGFRAFWHDRSRGREIGCIVGLDLAPSPDGHHLLESNLNPAQRLERARLHERDPFARNLVDHASDRGFRHLVVVDNRYEGINPLTARQYRERAEQRDLDLTIVDRAHLPDTSHASSLRIPRDPPPETLVARLRSYPVSTDHLLTDKLATHRALRRYREAREEPALRLPVAGTTPVLGDASPDDPFPNVVAKQSDAGQGERVVFAKAESPAHAARLFEEGGRDTGDRAWTDRVKRAVRAPGHIFEAYVPPSTLADGRLHIVRAHVLVTPGDVAYLSAHRVVSGRPVPERLEPGIVEDPDPFIVNYSADATYEVVPPDEEDRVRDAALAVGRGLAWALGRGFEVRP